MMEIILNENRSRKSDTPTPVEFTVNLGPSKTTYHSSGVPPAPAREGVKSTRMSKGLLLAGTVGIAFVAPAAVRGALSCLERGDVLGTAAGSLDRALVNDPSRVKVVVDTRGRAVYFSRAPIPFDREGSGKVIYHQHVGVYAYTREALEAWVRLPPVPEERWERLEQLRPLLHGIPMGVTLFDGPAAPGVDTPADLTWAEAEITRQLREVSP